MRNPSYSFSTDTLTLQVLAWFGSLDVRQRLTAQMQAQPWITHPPLHAEPMLLTALEEALTCFWADPVFGPALHALARHRLQQAHLEDSVARAIAVEGVVDAGHALYYADRSESYAVPPPTADEVAIFQRVVDERGELSVRLNRMSLHWHGEVCRGAADLRSFFLGYLDALRSAIQMPAFVCSLLQESLTALDWHVIAAAILRVDQPSACRCTTVGSSMSVAVKTALLQERCAWIGKTLHDEGQALPEPMRTSVLFLADLCDKTTGVLGEINEEPALSHQVDRATKQPTTLEAVLEEGLPAFSAWVRKQTKLLIFREGHLAANPVACYLSARLGDRTHLYEGSIYTASGAKPLPKDFQRFLWDFHDAFAGSAVTASVLADWLANGKPLPYRPHFDEEGRRHHQEICQALGQVITLVRQGSFRDPNQPTEEECLGIALAKFCSWEGPRLARTCLRLCSLALSDANYATLERLLCEYFGEELFD